MAEFVYTGMATNAPTSIDHVSEQPLLVRMLLATIFAVGANLSLLFSATSAGIGDAFVPLSVALVVSLTVLGVVGAGLLYAILTVWIATPVRAFRRLAIAVLVLSLAPNGSLIVMAPTATAAAVGVLASMTLLTAVICIVSIPSMRSSR